MDDNSLRRRHNEPPYTNPDTRFNPENQGRGFTGSQQERFRPSPLSTSPPSTTRRAAQAFPGYFHVPSPSFPAAIQPTNLQYQGSPNFAQDQRQQQQQQQQPQQQQQQQQNFAAYTSDIMYGNVYNSASQFQQTRQPGTMQLLSDVPTPYFNESTPATETSSLPHDASTPSAVIYPPQQQQRSPGDRSNLLQHSPEDRGSLIPQSFSTMSTTGIPQVPEVMEEQEFPPPTSGMEAAYSTYQAELKAVFGNIIADRLAEAGQSLLDVSEWLLGHVVDLGLTVDEVSLHPDRIQLWREFNGAWLGVFQRQKELLESGLQISAPKNILTPDFMKLMGDNLIRMCDKIEKFGLVDYQYGVEEERIIAIVSKCLDLQEAIEKPDDQGNTGQSSGTNRAPS
ncbi:hypothetical protein K3495_g10917 [Podosphaera aphanis]|nr:hypothetical protein K3495_g10917 [Podosphaera aphanis]